MRDQYSLGQLSVTVILERFGPRRRMRPVSRGALRRPQCGRIAKRLPKQLPRKAGALGTGQNRYGAVVTARIRFATSIESNGTHKTNWFFFSSPSPPPQRCPQYTTLESK